jgi:hypothetical protein
MILRPSALTVDMNRRPSAIAHPGDRAEAEAMQADPLVVRYFSELVASPTLWAEKGKLPVITDAESEAPGRAVAEASGSEKSTGA